MKRKRKNQITTTGQAEMPVLATAAALSTNLFQAQSAGDAIPDSWEERAAKAWEYYQQEPIIANAINAWRAFALGDEIVLRCKDDRNEERNVLNSLRISFGEG